MDRDLKAELEEAVTMAEGATRQRREAEAQLRAAEARAEALQVQSPEPLSGLFCRWLWGGFSAEQEDGQGSLGMGPRGAVGGACSGAAVITGGR